MITVPPKGDPAKRMNAHFVPLLTEAQIAPDMTVRIQQGSFWTAQGIHVEYIGGNSPTLTAPSQDAKWVVIALTGSGFITTIDGSSGTNPSLPAIPDDTLPLAGIFVGVGAARITSDMVFDIRPLWSMQPETVADLSGELATRPTTIQMNDALLLKSDTIGTPSTSFTLNQDQTGTSSSDAELVVNRGDEGTVAIRWSETSVQWQFSNDGNNWSPLGTNLDLFYTKDNLDVDGVLDARYYTETEIDAGFAIIAHTHVAADVTDFDTATTTELNANSIGELSDIDVATTAPQDGDVLVYDAAGTTWANTVLTEADISDLGTYEIAFSKNTAFNRSFGTGALDVTSGTDVRLSDNRDPNVHTHTKADVTDFSDSDYATSAQGTTADNALQNIASESLSDLSDALTGMVPTDGQVLTFDTTNGWQSETLPTAPVASVAGKTGIVTLVEGDITDLDKYTQAGVDALLATKATIATPTFTGTVGFPTYTKGALPAQAVGHQIYVSDATGSSLVGSMCFSNGTVWIDATTGAAVV